MESVELSAKSVDEAVQQALIRLGKSRDEVEVTVLSEGHKGILGFVRGDSARVRVTVRGELAATTPLEAVSAPRAAAPRTRAPRPAPRTPEVPPEVGEVEMPAQSVDTPPAVPPRPSASALVARDTLEELLEKMGIDADVVFKGGDGADEAPILLDVEGEDLGILIGRRGETLSSLQFLVNLIVGKRLQAWTRVLVDVEGYRARREEALRTLATRVAERVQLMGQAMALEPMPANERRIVHLTLQGSPYVFTESTGYGEDRKVNVMTKVGGAGRSSVARDRG